jgi:hypothetical protein
VALIIRTSTVHCGDFPRIEKDQQRRMDVRVPAVPLLRGA